MWDKYNISWDFEPFGIVDLILEDEYQFLNESGNQITLDNMQGGEFSESGHLFYVISGYYDTYYDYDGISVFDMQTGRMIAHSLNGIEPFNYEFTPGYTAEEPEGLTIWDLDDRSPEETGGVRGQLHVIMLDNGISWAVEDDVYLKHYTNTISVDVAYSGGDEYGTPENPFNTIQEALKRIQCINWLECPSYCPWSYYKLPPEKSLPEGVWCRYRDDDPSMIECFYYNGSPWYPDLHKCYLCEHPWEVTDPTECFGWDGARIKIKADYYPESFTIDKQMQLLADGGTVNIGGHITLEPSAAVNIAKSGMFKIH